MSARAAGTVRKPSGACAFALATTVALAATGAFAGAPEAVFDRLERTGAMGCRPALRHFCANVHVGCAGRSSIPAPAFVVSLRDGRLHLEDPRSAPAAHAPTPRGELEWAHDRSYALARLQPPAGYLKIVADGSYSYRIYRRGKAYMSYGACR